MTGCHWESCRISGDVSIGCMPHAVVCILCGAILSPVMVQKAHIMSACRWWTSLVAASVLKSSANPIVGWTLSRWLSSLV